MGGVSNAGVAGAVSDQLLSARAFLSRAAEPANIPLWGLVRRHGPIEAVGRLLSGDVRDELRGLSGRVQQVDPDADLAAAERHGLRLVVPESGEWPHFAMAALERTGEMRLRDYEGGRHVHRDGGEDIPPLALWVRGTLDLSTLAVRSVGVVGARSATPYGQRVAADLGYGLALRDFVVVSGGAYGIDAAAHKGALAAGGVTVVVSAGGAELPYPPSHAQLFGRAAESGAVISESPVGCAPRRGRFLTRNRLIAALSTGTVVVEASARSGALNTAGHAGRLDRPVMAVPGPISSGQSVGCHMLLRTGAELVTGVEDVVALIGSASDLTLAFPDSGGDTGGASGGRPDLRARLDALEPVERAVHDGLPVHREITAEALAASCALPVLDVVRALPGLELAGLIERTRDGYRRVRSERPGGRTRAAP